MWLGGHYGKLMQSYMTERKKTTAPAECPPTIFIQAHCCPVFWVLKRSWKSDFSLKFLKFESILQWIQKNYKLCNSKRSCLCAMPAAWVTVSKEKTVTLTCTVTYVMWWLAASGGCSRSLSEPLALFHSKKVFLFPSTHLILLGVRLPERCQTFWGPTISC